MRVKVLSRADHQKVFAYAVVRGVIQGTRGGDFVLLLEAVDTAAVEGSWYELRDGVLFQVSLFDEVSEIVVDRVPVPASP